MSQLTEHAEVAMPQLSDSMADGTVLAWLPAEGAHVSVGDDLVEIETDKATMTYQSEGEGYLERLAAEGESHPVGTVIARLLPSPPESASANGEAPEPPEPTVSVPAPEPPPAGDSARGNRASPLARRLAAEHGVDLNAVSGTGPGERIVLADVERAAGIEREGSPSEPKGPSAPVSAIRDAPVQAKGEVSLVEPTRVQQVVARRMAEAKSTIPDFSMSSDAAVDELLSLREELRARVGADEVVPSVNDFVIKAAAMALRRHPGLNAAYRDGRFERFSRINIGVAVAAPDGLFVPTVFDADESTVGTIARKMRELAGRAREGALTPPELSGGTFTISNLGMFGIRDFTPIINPPQVAILGVGRVDRVAVEEDGSLAWRSRMPLTVVGDHRALNGADAAEFLASVRDVLEAPLQLVL